MCVCVRRWGFVYGSIYMSLEQFIVGAIYGECSSSSLTGSGDALCYGENIEKTNYLICFYILDLPVKYLEFQY